MEDDFQTFRLSDSQTSPLPNSRRACIARLDLIWSPTEKIESSHSKGLHRQRLFNDTSVEQTGQANSAKSRRYLLSLARLAARWLSQSVVSGALIQQLKGRAKSLYCLVCLSVVIWLLPVAESRVLATSSEPQVSSSQQLEPSINCKRLRVFLRT